MIITHIHIENFRNIESIEITPNRALCLFGMNRQCKSSVIFALQMLLFGWCPLTDRRGSKPQFLIRDDAAEANIEADVDGLRLCLNIGRSKSAWAAVNPATGEIAFDSRDAWWASTGVNRKHAEVCAMPGEFLFSKELGDILSELLQGDVTAERVLELAGPRADWLRDFAKRKLCALTDLKKLGQVAYDTRTEYNRDMKRAQAELESIGFLPPVKDHQGRERTPEEWPKIETAIAELEKRRQALLVEKGRAESVGTPEQAAEAQAAAAAAREALAAADYAAQHANELHAGLTHERNLAEREATKARETLAAVASGGDCPMCGRKLTKAVTDALSAALKAAEQKYSDAREAANAALTELQPLRDAARAARERFERAQAAIPQAAAGRALEEVEAELADVAAKIERGRELCAALERRAEQEGLQNQCQWLGAESERLTWAVTAFKDGEISKQFMASGLDDFVHRANIEAAPFGVELGVTVDGKNVYMTMDGRPVAHDSRGGWCIAKFALAMAFADTGAIVVLDDLNDLDIAFRKTLLKRLREQTLGSVIVAAAWQSSNTDMAAVAAALEPVTVCWAESGAAKAT